MYPSTIDMCNCGIKLEQGLELPQPQLLEREEIDKDSPEWRMQSYGAALYWHLATTLGDGSVPADADLLRGKDVLEVGCGRGGGACYLAEVTGPRRYLAIDVEEDNVELCRSLSTRPEGLSFEVANAACLAEQFPDTSFDVVLCIQSIATFAHPEKFIRGASVVLRPGGRLILCDMFTRRALQDVLDSIQGSGLTCDAVSDISNAVNAASFCFVADDRFYVHIVARKLAQPDSSSLGR